MNPQSLLNNLAEKGVEISLHGGDLRICASRDALLEKDLELIRRNKAQILSCLRSTMTSSEEEDTQASFKEYKYPNGEIFKLSKEEFYRVVDLVRLLLKMDYEICHNGHEADKAACV